MSVFPGETTKQILSAPAFSIRSTTYSLTARGRSTPSSSLLPTGSSSFEKASGWIRLPAPAAGTIPHITGLRRCSSDRCEHGLELRRAPLGRVLRERALARRGCDSTKCSVVQRDRTDSVIAVLGDEDLRARGEALIEPSP